MLLGQPLTFSKVTRTGDADRFCKEEAVRRKTLEMISYNAHQWGHYGEMFISLGWSKEAGEAARIAVSWALMGERMRAMYQM